jgi:phage baseplate assembly protein W
MFPSVDSAQTGAQLVAGPAAARRDAAEDAARAFLGIGWAFPPRLESGGRIAEAIYEQDVREAITIVLGTNPGERVMRPDFGAGLNTFIFEPVNPTTLARVEAQVRDSLITWERRIDVENVQVRPQGNPPSTLLIELSYVVRATNSLQNLVYPFYLQEGSAS